MQKQLAGGLILRTLSEGFASDREQLVDFYRTTFGEGEPEAFANAISVWAQDLVNDHPLTTHDDIFVIVDPAHEDRMVSATLLIPQTWRYEGIPIAVGRPELVATSAEYRGRGLVRTLFDAVHERSAVLGHQMQVITGIPYFYRQFGYTMALDLGDTATLPIHVFDDLPPETKPGYTLRAATTDDIPQLAKWHDSRQHGCLMTEVRTPEWWRYELGGRNVDSIRARAYHIIVNSDGGGIGHDVGYIELNAKVLNKHVLYCSAYVVGEDASYVETFDDVMRGIKQWATVEFGACPTLLLFASGNHASLYTLIDRTFGGDLYPQPYKWYVRVPEPVAFLRHIQPVLEQRLEGSGAHRYTGELKIGFFNLKGITFKFERGRIVEIEPAQGKDGYGVSFPWHLFWNVVFGDHSAQEINALLPDVWTNSGRNAVLMETLFPKKKSFLEGLG